MRRVILNLHGLGDPGRPLDDPAEGRYWVSPEILQTAIHQAAALSDKVETAFTFDDGNLSDLEIGAPMLGAAGHSATFFVLSSRIGQKNYLSADDLGRLIAMGHRIGCHGADHVDWTGLDAAGLTREVIDARAAISKVTGRPVTEAALPLGRYNAKVLGTLRNANYERVYSSDGGAVTGTRWPIPRTSLTKDMTEAMIADILLGREPLKRGLRRRLARTVKTRL